MSGDMRRYARQTNMRLLVGFILLLFLVGDGLIYWLYGRNAAVVGLICIGALLLPLILIWLILMGLEWIGKKGE